MSTGTNAGAAAIRARAEGATLDDLIRPVRPHDHLSFEELAAGYNFRNTSDAPVVLSRLLVKEAQRRTGPVRVLDIGCGRGMARNPGFVRAIRPHFDELWGIEPNTEVTPDPAVFDEVRFATLEGADLPEETFDIAYSFMVMEHVMEPLPFMRALARVLKPGGVYLFATPSAHHYFTRSARALRAIGLDELVLRIIMRGRKDQYHYPVAYALNSRRAIGRVCRQAGLAEPECAFIEPVGPLAYMRGPLRPVFHALALKRRLVRRREALLTLIGRITRPA